LAGDSLAAGAEVAKSDAEQMSEADGVAAFGEARRRCRSLSPKATVLRKVRPASHLAVPGAIVTQTAIDGTDDDGAVLYEASLVGEQFDVDV